MLRRFARGYTFLIIIFSLGLGIILSMGEDMSHLRVTPSSTLTPPHVATAPVQDTSTGSVLLQNLHHPLALLLMQAITIILLANACGYAVQKINQPKVIGEILAGIVLGPSLVGMLWPEFTTFVFPADSLGNLKLLSQVGLILFMFIVGMDIDLSSIKKNAATAVMVSHVSVIFPFLLGALVALWLFNDFAPAGVSFTSFSLFMGIAMSITAFPVLARILQERNMSRAPLGTLALTCAAIDDVTAWCILAAIIGAARAGDPYSAIGVVALAVLYVIAMLLAVRPWLARRWAHIHSQEQVNGSIMLLALLVLLTSAFLTELIGIHALFGAFLAGVIMPSEANFRKGIARQLEAICTIVLLPLFFAFTGLRTEIGLLDDAEAWLTCGAIILIATIGKLGGSSLAARWSGMTWRDSLVIGTLMNTRGLMELIVLNIGYDLGILSATMFSIMVLMALATTFMTGPLVDLILKSRKKPEKI